MIFQECIEDAGAVTTTEKAHEWIAANLGSGGGSRESYSSSTLPKTPGPVNRVGTVKDVLAEEVLPHIGGSDMLFEKAAYIGLITKKVLDVFTGRVPHDDRDAYPNKKVELPGNLMGNLFRYFFGTKVIKDMKSSLTKEIHNGFWKSSGKIEDIINPSNVYKILKSTIVTIGMKSSLATGNFSGGKMGVKQGISQVMNRLTYLSGISHLRRLSTPIEKTGKLLAPRKLHATQYGFVCPAETPEGHAVGVVKNLSSTAIVTLPMSPEPVVAFLYDALTMKNLDQVSREELFTGIRIMVNGAWIGMLMVDAQGAVDAAATLRAAKQSGQIHIHTGIVYKPARREIWINTEGGRLIRPVLTIKGYQSLTKASSVQPPSVAWTTWTDVLMWRSPEGHSLVEYIDPSETENLLISMDFGPDSTEVTNEATHVEIHPSTMLGTMASNIPFPDHNQSPRNSYQSAMGKQAMGVYSLNFNQRLDTMANLLWYSSVPLASPYMSRFYRAQSMPSGFNIVVAIMTYGGYNQEDSIMINRASLDRGLFRSEFYRTYKDEEKKNQASGEEERFCRPNPLTTRHMKLANYEKLGADGIVPENVFVTQDDVLIGKVAPIRLRGHDGAAQAGINHASLHAMSSVAAAAAVEAAGGKRFRDSSKLLRANESGYVDKIYRGRNGEGYSFVKIRVREERVPVIGDKFSSRHGQKGTCGLILDPCDMPQTKDGIVPDLIINPHCFVGETQVAMANGLAQRIDSFTTQGLESVLTWNPTNQKMISSFSLGRSNRGMQDTVIVTLEDGRDIRCTPDHRFKVVGPQGPIWKEAKDLTNQRLIMGFRGTMDTEDPRDTSWNWTFTSGTLHFDFSNRYKWLAFARLCGSVHNRMIICTTEHDAHSVMADIIHVTNEYHDLPAPVNNLYKIQVPDTVLTAIAQVDLDLDTVPLSFLREYLGALYGAIGRAPYLLGDRFGKVEIETDVARHLLRLGIETMCNNEFREKIGFRHNISKSMRLDLACAYENTYSSSQGAEFCCTQGSATHFINTHDAHWFYTDGYGTYTMPVQQVTPDAPAPVYDIGVAETHMFLAEGCAVSNCIPSRMTIAQLMETLLGRVGCELGFLGDATPFNTSMTAKGLADILQSQGLEPHSNEVLYCGYTGRQLETSIFMGPCFYQRLKHMVNDKIHSRSTGPLVMLTRQPAEGRARDGGLRFGEMERDVMIAHGASVFLKERMMEASDNFEVHVCKGCGIIAVANREKNIWKCTGCGNTTEFAQVRIPYAYKLFLQELESMNISSRILPESRMRSLTN
jgi:DNA-directed RNA polymerase beta subunit